MQILTLIAGYPASGKSTLINNEFDGAVHVNRDAVGGSVKDLIPIIRGHLEKGKSVVTDNLFATRESRHDFVDLARDLKIPCYCVILDTSIEDAQVNAVCRLVKHFGHFPTDAEMKTAKHPNIFPPAVLFKYRKEYQEPKMTEGFANIERIPFKRLPWPGTEKALLLDFDGTIRECPSGNKFPTDPKDIRIRPNVKEVLTKFKKEGFRLLGISNQSGIAKGDLTDKQCLDCFVATKTLIGLDIDVLYCPHRVPPVSCFCRKPGVGMPVTHIIKYKLDPAKCVLVGDMTTDKTCAGRIGMQYMHADQFFADGHKRFI